MMAQSMAAVNCSRPSDSVGVDRAVEGVVPARSRGAATSGEGSVVEEDQAGGVDDAAFASP